MISGRLIDRDSARVADGYGGSHAENLREALKESHERIADMLQADVADDFTNISRNGKPAKKSPQPPLPIKNPTPGNPGNLNATA